MFHCYEADIQELAFEVICSFREEKQAIEEESASPGQLQCRFNIDIKADLRPGRFAFRWILKTSSEYESHVKGVAVRGGCTTIRKQRHRRMEKTLLDVLHSLCPYCRQIIDDHSELSSAGDLPGALVAYRAMELLLIKTNRRLNSMSRLWERTKHARGNHAERLFATITNALDMLPSLDTFDDPPGW